MIGWAFRQLMLWGGVALAVYAIVTYRMGQSELAPASAPAWQASAPATEPARRAGSSAPNALVFRANNQGHVFVDAVVNGASIRFLVDTGATMVALSGSDAQAAGIRLNDLDYRGHVRTASGVAPVAPVKLRELRIGQFEADDVPAIVMDNLSISLLGQSFLNRLNSYEMRDGVLTLYWN